MSFEKKPPDKRWSTNDCIGSYNNPIRSYGIILYTRSFRTIWYYICKQRHSYAYIDFLRTLKPSKSKFSMMFSDERENILKYDYSTLLKDINSYQHRSVYEIKFNLMKENGSLRNMIKKTKPLKNKLYWGFPKGRKDFINEGDIECGMREFNEETNIPISSITLSNVSSVKEMYVGSDFKWYQTIYFVAYTKKKIPIELMYNPLNILCKPTVSDEIESACWITLKDAKFKLSTNRVRILENVEFSLT